MKLRDYQKDAVQSVYDSWKSGKLKYPLIVAPTGSGKSAILGTITKDVAERNRRVLILTHQSELIKQDAETIKRFTKEKIGIYSAQLGKKEMKTRIVVASIQSVGKKATHFDPFDLIIIDEAHLIPTKDGTLYKKFLSESLLMNPKIKIIGLTATEYRLDSGLLYEGEGTIFDGICFEITVKKLLKDGWICPIISKAGINNIDLSSVKKRGREFITAQLQESASDDRVLNSAVKEIVECGESRKSWLIFSPGLDHAEKVRDLIRLNGYSCELITGKDKKEERNKILEDYKNGEIRCIVNCQVLTTGFDAPNIDLIALLTATMSTSLYIQMLGRGTRIKKGKDNCLLLDFGGNVERHGFFDEVQPLLPSNKKGDGEAPVKMCDECGELLHASARICICGFIFPPPKLKHKRESYDGAILKTDVKPEVFNVHGVNYSIHKKTGKPDSIRIDYSCSKEKEGNLNRKYFKEWVCPEHKGYARHKCIELFEKEFHIKTPSSCEEFLKIKDEIRKPAQITVKTWMRYPEISKRIY